MPAWAWVLVGIGCGFLSGMLTLAAIAFKQILDEMRNWGRCDG